MGSVGKRITKLALNNGLECVGGLTRTSNLGLDIGTVIGIDKIGINITSNTLTELLLNTKPNIIFDSTSTTNSIDENYDLFKSILSLSTDENNPNGEYFNIITVEMGFYFPWKTHHELSSKYTNITKINELHTLSTSKKIGIIGTGVQDLFFHSILPSLLPLVPDFNTIKISLSLNLNHPYYAQYVSGVDVDSDSSCTGSFISNYFPNAAEQIVYRTMIDIFGMNLDNAMIELNECQTLFNYDEKVLCVGCGNVNDVQYYIEPGKSIGSNSTFTVIIDDLVISVSLIAAVYNSFDALSTYYHIIGPYNYQSVSFDHVDDFLVTAQSAIQRINDVMNGKGIITDNLPPIQFYNGENNYKSRVVHSLKDVDKKEL